MVGEEIFINVYEWNDTWTDLTDPGPQTNNDWFTQLNLVTFETYYPQSVAENDIAQYVAFDTQDQVAMVSNQRYLVCTQTFNPEIKFGYDNSLNYDGNQGITAMPVSPIAVEQTAGTLTWFTGGWNGSSAPAIGLRVVPVAELGLNEEVALAVKAFPNPANDLVTISAEATGNATITVTDVSGKVAMTEEVSFAGGQTEISISNLDAGVYVFNLLLEDGLTSQFNIVKK